MRVAPLVVIVLCVAVLGTGLGRTGYLDWREARDAAVARELIDRHEALTPLLGREALFEKPVLAYVPQALVQGLFDGDPARSRLVRALIALALLALTASLGAELHGARAGWLAAGVLASTLALPLAARTDGTQLLGTLLGWLGAAGFADALFGRRRGRDARLVVTWGALAGALVCAGPLPALWPVGAVALYLALARPPGGWRLVRPLPGLAIVAGLALPWYGAMFDRYGLLFLSHVPAFPYGVDVRGPWWSGLVLAPTFLVVGLFPWSALLPEALRHASTFWRRARRAALARDPAGVGAPGADPVSREAREESAAHFFVACLAAALVPVLFYPGPPLPAALPALPAAAILCARLLDHLFEDPERVGPLVARATVMLALLGSVGGVGMALVATRVPYAAGPLRLVGAALLVTSCVPFLASFIGRRRIAALLFALPVAVGTPLVTTRLLPALEPLLSARAVAQAVNAVAPARAPLVLAEPPSPSLRYYLRHDLVLREPLPRALRRERASDGLTYVAFRPALEARVLHASPGPLEIMMRTPSLVLARVRPG